MARILVLSAANTPNFGDRLGLHNLSILPASAEVRHAYFCPWSIPPGPFDLLILGIGNSLYPPVMGDELLALMDSIPARIGIFGTQYHSTIDPARMSAIVSRLDVWFARHRRDAELWGNHNTRHLGDWLIAQFPMTRWTIDGLTCAGPEIWQDLPLDRTIQRIQSYRRVFSERLHPLLCALTSADLVSYREQREYASSPSGKFDSMFLDIFGRTFAEMTEFEVDRKAVEVYRKLVLANLSEVSDAISVLSA